jgi:HK97 family phage major capsid protein
LIGDLQIPRQNAASSVTWLAEQDAASESTPTLDKITLAPKTAAVMLDMSRKFIQQSSIRTDEFAENDLTQVLAQAIQTAFFHGTGASNQPTGLAATAGIGSVAGGANGAAPSFANIVQLETEVAADNADAGTMAYVTNSKVRGILKRTPRVSSTDSKMILDPGDAGELNGHKLVVTNSVASNLVKGSSGAVCSAIFFGNWADSIMGLWGTLDLIIDPFTASSKGDVRVVAFQDVDFGFRHPESFAAMLDALTT